MFEIETLHWVTFLGISSLILLVYLLTGKSGIGSTLDWINSPAKR